MSRQPARTIIRNASLADEDQPCTLILHDGVIESIDVGATNDTVISDTTQVIDADGLLAVPGMTDLYARLREPGLSRKGTIASEAQAALATGFTRVLCAPDTQPVIDNVATVELVLHRAELGGAARVLPIAALTIGLDGEQLSELATLQKAGCPVAGQADRPLESTNVLFSAMEYAASFNLPLFMTARDAQLGVEGCAHTGAMATRLGLPAVPVAAETVALARLLELCRETGCRMHISRISSARAVQMIDDAKQQAMPVTCDVGLHHLFFTDNHLAGYDALFHSAVPFRSESDREALRQGIASGVIDAICTDHAPHDIDAGLAPFPATEPGLAAYQWAMPLILQLPDILGLSLTRVFGKFNEAPCRIIDGSPAKRIAQGQQADFFLLSTGEAVASGQSSGRLAGNNHPLTVHDAADIGLAPLRGKVSHVFTQGRVHDLTN